MPYDESSGIVGTAIAVERFPRLALYYVNICFGLQVDGRQVAIKKVGDVFSDLVDAKRIVREIKLLRHFDGHENIIAIADIMTIPPDTPDFKDVYIVTNLMESDMDRIIASGQPLTDQHFQYFIYQACSDKLLLRSSNLVLCNSFVFTQTVQ